MASLVTLQELRDSCRARADMQNSGFIQDSELDAYINSSARELYDLLTTKFEDYYLTSSSFTVTFPTTSFAVPSDFYKLRGVDIFVGNSYYETAQPFTFQERNLQQNPIVFPFAQTSGYLYQLRAGNIHFLNNQYSSGTITGRIWYIPRMTKLVDATDTFDGINGWEEYIIINTAIKMLQKEESDTSVLLALKKEMKERIEETAANRDAGSPERVTDVTQSLWGPFRRY